MSCPTQVTSKAVYFQAARPNHQEFALVQVVAKRDCAFEMIDRLIRETNGKRRIFNDDAVFESFWLLNQLRETTFELGEAIEVWLQGFTKVVRPFLHEGDYIVKMVSAIDFVNGTKLRRIFNFHLGKGNILMLPMPIPRADSISSMVSVSSKLAQQIESFAAPVESRVIKFYQTMKRCLPEDVYKKVFPINDWMLNPWFPRVKVVHHGDGETEIGLFNGDDESSVGNTAVDESQKSSDPVKQRQADRATKRNIGSTNGDKTTNRKLTPLRIKPKNQEAPTSSSADPITTTRMKSARSAGLPTTATSSNDGKQHNLGSQQQQQQKPRRSRHQLFAESKATSGRGGSSKLKSKKGLLTSRVKSPASAAKRSEDDGDDGDDDYIKEMTQIFFHNPVRRKQLLEPLANDAAASSLLNNNNSSS